VVFNVEDHILVKNLYKFKGYRAKNSKFPNRGWTINGLNYLLKKLRDTGTTAWQPGSGRRQSARTVKNVDAVNDLLLSHKGALKCIKQRVKRDRHSSLANVQHYSSGFSIKMSRTGVRRNSLIRQLCTLVRLSTRVTR